MANQIRALSTAVIIAGILFATISQPAHAGGGEGRTKKPFGIYTSVVGDPHISLFGINAAWNLHNHIRATIGYGSIPLGIVNGSTWGAGAKWMMFGGNFTPVAGINYAQFTGDFLGLVALDSLNIISLNVGFDWQADVGFNLGFGVNKALNQTSTFIPYLSLGWFF